MTYLGMPFGMWTLFVPSFRNQLTAVFGYGTNTNCSALKKDAESLPRPHIYLALSSLTFDTSLCAASCFTSSTPLASNASALY